MPCATGRRAFDGGSSTDERIKYALSRLGPELRADAAEMWKQLSMILDARPVTYEWWAEAETIGEDPVFRFDPAITDGTRLFACVHVDPASGKLRYRAMVNSYADDEPFEWWCDTPWAMEFLLAALEVKVSQLTTGE